MSEIIDISPTVSAAIAVWPGDVAFQRDVSLDMHGGDNLTLSAITTTVPVSYPCWLIRKQSGHMLHLPTCINRGPLDSARVTGAISITLAGVKSSMM